MLRYTTKLIVVLVCILAAVYVVGHSIERELSRASELVEFSESFSFTE
jgi:hypothetical protein